MMTEEEYIKATNQTKIRAAVTILRDVMEGDEYGVNANIYRATMIQLTNMSDRLGESYEIKPEERHIGRISSLSSCAREG